MITKNSFYMGIYGNTKLIKTYLFNYSVARLTIYKARQILVYDGKQIDITKLFVFTVNKDITVWGYGV